MQHQILFKMDLTDEQYEALYDVCAVWLIIHPVQPNRAVAVDAEIVLWMQDHEAQSEKAGEEGK